MTAVQNILDQQNSDEVPFSFEELFFSRTDERGIVLSGNSVFQRISMYGWEEILHKPHNIIRHQDMPKGVFWLFWNTLKKGEPIGAYVKNKAKDGRHYWVFAIATPINGGYLSVRLKPSSELMPIVEREYRSLVNLEIHSKLSPKDSAEKLLADLKSLGFNDYSEFMSVAIGKEMTARNKHLASGQDITLSYFDDLMKSSQNLIHQAGNIFIAYEKNRNVPLNLRIQAAQLGDSGATIGVISNNYNIISTEIKDRVGEFMNSAQQVFKTINSARFLFCTAKIQGEVIEFFGKETLTEISKEREMSYLEQQQQEYRNKAAEGLKAIVIQIKQFQEDCQNMRRLSSGLEVTRVMVQSSSATVGLIIALAKQGYVNLSNSLSIMFGAEIGTCSDTIVAIIGGKRQAIKTSLFNLIFNIVSVIIGFIALPEFLSFVRFVSSGAGIEHQIANGHLMFNLIGALVFLPFLPLMEKLLNRLLPDNPYISDK